MSKLDVPDDFSRSVYCILGIPIDDVTMDTLVARIHQAAASRSRLFISTANLNFAMLSQRDAPFRRSILASGICSADGIGVLIICKLLGVPITTRVAGSDIPAALQATPPLALSRPLSIAFFGGDPGVGRLACDAINRSISGGLECVAAIDPGLMTPQMLTSPGLVADVNATGADFLIAALGAQKGQAWIFNHLATLTVPVVSHLGATLNFLAGTVRRAPQLIQSLGLEWLWRIKEEPKLLPRYVGDGLQLMGLLVRQVLPLALWLRWNRDDRGTSDFSVHLIAETPGQSRIILTGVLSDSRLKLVRDSFRGATQAGDNIVLDVAGLRYFAMGFAGLVLMLEKITQQQGRDLTIAVASGGVGRALRWCGMRHLISNKLLART